jgi:uncharacterized protein (TIGR00369 family)
MSDILDPEAFARQLNTQKLGTMIDAHGTEFLHAGEGYAKARLAFKPSLTQLTGLFHAGAIIALADETATVAAMWEINPTADFKPEQFPLTIQLSVNLIRNTNQGTITAEAHIVHRGRTTMVIEVKVRDEQERLLATVVVTALVPQNRST